MQTSSTSVELNPFGSREVFFAVLVGAFNYFVDVYDLVIFIIVRIASLKDFGFCDEILRFTQERIIKSKLLFLG